AATRGRLSDRPEPPTRADLKAFLGLQLGLSVAFAAVVAAALSPFRLVGEGTALMMLSLPFGAVPGPSAVLLERRLDYRTPALIDLVNTVTYYTWALATVKLGWGVWGLASGNVVRVAVATAVMLVIFPLGRMLPSPSWRRVRPLLGFGFQYQ